MQKSKNKMLVFFVGLVLALFSSFIYAASTEEKEWTFLIFLNGNNSLDEYGTKNIEQMKKVGSNKNMNVVVQWASKATQKTKRIYVKKGSVETLDNLGLVDMGDVQNLKDFIAWGVKKYPAKHYFIDVWNHGSGWHNAIFPKGRAAHAMRSSSSSIHANDISFDDLSGHAITTEQLGQALKFAADTIGHPVDIYGSDACLMAMAEVANEMSGAVNYFIGSEELEPGDGWPYDTLLSKWQALPQAQSTDVAKILVDVYVKYYQDNPGEDATMAAYDMTKLPALNDAVRTLGADLRTLSDDDRQMANYAVSQSQSFEGEYIDLRDLSDHLANPNLKSIPTEHLAAVNQAVQDLVIANGATEHVSGAHGISIWVPMEESIYQSNAQRYRNLAFNEATDWNKTILYLLQGPAIR